MNREKIKTEPAMTAESGGARTMGGYQPSTPLPEGARPMGKPAYKPADDLEKWTNEMLEKGIFSMVDTDSHGKPTAEEILNRLSAIKKDINRLVLDMGENDSIDCVVVGKFEDKVDNAFFELSEELGWTIMYEKSTVRAKGKDTKDERDTEEDWR